MTRKQPTGIWCLTIIIARPDYKRPEAEVETFFFKSKEAAEKKLECEKHYYLVNRLEFCFGHDGKTYYSSREPKDPENPKIDPKRDFTIDDLDSDSWQRWAYMDSYMAMPPFSGKIEEVMVDEDEE